MTNPPYMLQHLEAVAEVMQHPCVFRYLHVPVQSGSDAVLLAMNREYTVAGERKGTGEARGRGGWRGV